MRRAALQQAVGEAAGRGADVEAAAPGDATPSASSALASLMPPRETNGGGGVDGELDVRGDELPGLLRPRGARVRGGRPPRCTAAAARDREANRPRSARRVSRRTLDTARNATDRGRTGVHSGREGATGRQAAASEPRGSSTAASMRSAIRSGREADLLVQELRRAVGDVAVGQPDAEDPRRQRRPRSGTPTPRCRSRPRARPPRRSRAGRAPRRAGRAARRRAAWRSGRRRP